MRKSCPLTGSSERAVPVPNEYFYLRRWVHGSALAPLKHWRQFLDEPANAGVLTDRALGSRLADAFPLHGTHVPVLFSPPVGPTETLPVARLRQFVSYYFANPHLCADALARYQLYERDMVLTLDQIRRILDAALRPFEESVACFARLIERDRHEETGWYLADLFSCLVGHKDAWWQGVPLPDWLPRDLATFGRVTEWAVKENRILWLTMVWRIHVARQLLRGEFMILPDAEDRGVVHQFGREGWLSYQVTLFGDTHLRALAFACLHDKYDDSFLTYQVFKAHYPNVSGVMCAEELPDLVPLLPFSDLWYDLGVKKAESSTVRFYVHIFLSKVLNHVCQIRGLNKIVADKSEEEPVVRELFRNVVYCFLLGNARGCEGRCRMAARLRLTMVHHTRTYATAPIFHAWVQQVRHFVLFLLREWHFYTMEQADMERIYSTNRNRQQFIRLVRNGTRDCREYISRACAANFFGGPIDWTVIEASIPVKTKRPGASDKISGLIAGSHTRALATNLRSRKHLTFGILLLKKMTAVEKKFPPPTTSEQWAQLEKEDPPAWYDALHLIAWYLAKHRNGYLECAFLKALGMTATGVRMVYRWLIDYYEYQAAENGFKKKTSELYAANPRDFIILKRLLQTIEYYRMQGMYMLSVERWRSNVEGLRKRLVMEEWMPTPPELGLVYVCRGCHRIANPIATSPFTPSPPSTRWPTSEQARVKIPPMTYKTKKNKNKAATASTVRSAKKRKNRRRRAQSHEVIRTAPTPTDKSKHASKKPNHSMFLDKAYYNPGDGCIYCSRGRYDKTMGGLAGEEMVDWSAADDPTRPFYRSGSYRPAFAAADTRRADSDDEDGGTHAMEIDEVLERYRGQNRIKALATRLSERPVNEILGEQGGAAATTDKQDEEASRAKLPAHVRILLAQIERPIAERFFCQQPMRKIHAEGVWFSVEGRLYGFCKCGVLCPVRNEHMTNEGLSCMGHPDRSFAYDHYVWDPVFAAQKTLRNMNPLTRLFKRAGECVPVHAEEMQAIRSLPLTERRYPVNDLIGLNGEDPELLAQMVGGAYPIRCSNCRIARACRFAGFYDHEYRVRFMSICSSCNTNLRCRASGRTYIFADELLSLMPRSTQEKSPLRAYCSKR